MLSSSQSNNIQHSTELNTLYCPITLQIFKIAVMVFPSSYTVEAFAAEQLMQNNQPYPPQTLTITHYNINPTVRQVIEEYLALNPA